MRKAKTGFTIVELLLTLGIVSLLAAFATIALIRPQVKTSVDTTAVTLVADIKQQQLKAMVGDAEGSANSQPFGIYFEDNRYTLFRGSTYIVGDPNNFIVNLDTNINITDITFPGNTLGFNKRSGEVAGFVPGQNSLVVRSSISSEQKTIVINRYGTININ